MVGFYGFLWSEKLVRDLECLKHFHREFKMTEAKDGIRMTVLLKKSLNTVGNKAVQKVISGRIFFNTEYAAVVTNNSYTDSEMS